MLNWEGHSGSQISLGVGWVVDCSLSQKGNLWILLWCKALEHDGWFNTELSEEDTLGTKAGTVTVWQW